MSRISTIKTVVTTLAAALGVGFVMQIGASDSTAADTVVEDRSAVRTLMMSTNAQGEAVFGVPDVVTTPLNHAENVQAVVAVDVVYTEFAVPQMGAILATPIEGCAVTLTGVVEQAAMVALYLSAPCATNDDFVLRQGAFRITGRTNADGNAALLVPALTEDANFVVLFDNVEHASATFAVPDARLFDRAVLQWNGVFNLQLHAFESGASVGDPDHIWSASVHSAEDAISGEDGFVMRHGTTEADFPHLAEVYTYPAWGDPDDIIELQVGVAVTEQNCGREVDAFIIQTDDGQPRVTQKITASLPKCDAVGEVVILPGKFEDLTLASR